jgi:hypothetical protein
MTNPGLWFYSPLGRTFGPDFRFCTVSGDVETARWTPYIPAHAIYDVYLWWVSGWDRAENARFTVHHLHGEDIHLIDQSTGGEEWYHLGEYEFDQGTEGWVELSTEGCQQGKRVVADAVLFVPPEGIHGGDPETSPGVEVYPNPVASSAVISIPASQVYRLDIYDIQGRLVESLENPEGFLETVILNTDGWEPGVYFALAHCPASQRTCGKFMVVGN